jgi:hypothetical protein
LTSAICTLFEGHYHYGVAALINSLYRNGYRGQFYIGYRGYRLPPWATKASDNISLNWAGGKSLELAEGLKFIFYQLKPTITLHITSLSLCWNYLVARQMPRMQLHILTRISWLNAGWGFYETWMMHGVAMVHEVTSNDMPSSHPIRREWQKVIQLCNRQSTRELRSYINSGFCGISRKHIEFLSLWNEIIETAIKYYNPNHDQFMSLDRTYPFYSDRPGCL